MRVSALCAIQDIITGEIAVVLELLWTRDATDRWMRAERCWSSDGLSWFVIVDLPPCPDVNVLGTLQVGPDLTTWYPSKNYCLSKPIPPFSDQGFASMPRETLLASIKLVLFCLH